MKAGRNKPDGKVMVLVLFSLNRFKQVENVRKEEGLEKAREDLHKALTDTIEPNVVSLNSVLIKDRNTAQLIAEPILFGIYDEEQILAQKPYEIHHLDHFWILKGTRSEKDMRGTFLIILDERDSEVVRLYHGK
jgi:hypothetical protein